jgi:putative heavy-metal-binding protein
LQRLCQEGIARGANAIVAMRFDCNEIGGTASEIAAYGTAVWIVPDGQPQQQQQGAPGQGQQQFGQPGQFAPQG